MEEPSIWQEVGPVGVAGVVGALVGFGLGSPFDGWAHALVVVLGGLGSAALVRHLSKP